MLLPNRHGSSDKYRYGFQGQEMDDEIKGEGNSLNYKYRMHDPRVGRFFAMDMLFAKYPNISPYAFTANNPISNQEQDGNDYIVFVNHKTKTITIKAVYYTQINDDLSYNEAVKATEFWNNQSDKFTYDIGEEANKVSYDIKFDLSIMITYHDPARISRLDRENVGQMRRSGDLNFSDENRLIKDGSSNSFKILDDGHKLFKGKEEDEAITEKNGVTLRGRDVAVKKSRVGTETGAHELGHSLGFEHLRKTIMSTFSNSGRTSKVNTVIIGHILKKVNLGIGRLKKRNDSAAKAKLRTAPNGGMAPGNFNDGVVNIKPD